MGIRNRRSPEPELEVANRAAADPGNMDDNMVSSNSMADESTMGKVKGQIDLMARKTGLQVRKICLKKIGLVYFIFASKILAVFGNVSGIRGYNIQLIYEDHILVVST